MLHIGKNISYLIKQHNFKQDEFGEMFGLKRGVVSGYVIGRANPKLETVIEIAEHFSIPIDDLLKKDLSQEGITAPQHADSTTEDTNSKLLQRFEEVVAENAILKAKLAECEKSKKD